MNSLTWTGNREKKRSGKQIWFHPPQVSFPTPPSPGPPHGTGSSDGWAWWTSRHPFQVRQNFILGTFADFKFIHVCSNLFFVAQVWPPRVARDASGGSSDARGQRAGQPAGLAWELQAELWGHDQALARVSHSIFIIRNCAFSVFVVWFVCGISRSCCRNQSSAQKGEYLDWEAGEKDVLWDRRINSCGHSPVPQSDPLTDERYKRVWAAQIVEDNFMLTLLCNVHP